MSEEWTFVVPQNHYAVFTLGTLGGSTRLFDHARAAGPFRFWVFQRNTEARRLYERRGCRIVTLTDGHNNEEREPDVLYETPGTAISELNAV